jgi:hypothetical protein
MLFPMICHFIWSPAGHPLRHLIKGARKKRPADAPWVQASHLPWQTKQSLNIDGDSINTKRTTLDGFTDRRKPLSIVRPVEEDCILRPKGLK